MRKESNQIETSRSTKKTLVEKYKGFVFDLDGTIYRGEKLIPGADKTINKIRTLDKKVIFVSNKTTDSPGDYLRFLVSNGVEIYPGELITASTVIINYLSQNYPAAKFYAIGEEKFIEELQSNGFVYTQNYNEVEVVIVTLDRTLNYQKLEIAARSLENGAKFFAANIDDTCPVDSGEILDAGSTISALEKRTHRKLELHFGKPSEFMIKEVLNRIQLSKEDILITGDRIETDIAMGSAFGIDTALVNTGIKNFPNGSIKPAYILNSINNLFDVST